MDLSKYFWVDEPIDEEEPLADGDVHMESEEEEEEEEEEEDIRYENEDVLLRASLCPPAHGRDGESWSRFVLLDYAAYFDDRRNATTATCEMRDGMGSIHVTFCTAAPPLVSYFCVHYGGSLKLSHFAAEPQVLASAGGLALLRVPLGDESDSLDPNISQYFVYHAGVLGQSPTLTQLPHPKPYLLLDHHTAIVRHCTQRDRDRNRGLTLGHHGDSNYHDCSHCGYTIASLCPAHTQHSYQYNLILFRRDTMAWSCDTILTDKKTADCRSSATNTINIGGKRGTVGWVDLWRAILFCDVLAAQGKRKLRYVPLPPPLVEKESYWLGDPSVRRDINVIDGFIKCIDMKVRVVPGSSTFEGAFTSDGWCASTWSLKITPTLSRKWILECQIDSKELLHSMPTLKVEAGTAQPKLEMLHMGQPTLSLEDVDTVYFLAKIDYRDDKRNGWVFTVNMAKKAIRAVAEFGCGRTLGLGHVYCGSEISQYLKITPGIKGTQKRLGIPLPGSPAKKHHGTTTEIADVDLIPSWVHEGEKNPGIDYNALAYRGS